MHIQILLLFALVVPTDQYNLHTGLSKINRESSQVMDKQNLI